MTYADQWKALSSRIRGLMQAGQLHAQYLTVRSSDSYGRGKRLREQSEGVLSALLLFRDRFQNLLPPPALTAIDDFVARTSSLITDTSGTPDAVQGRVWAGLVMLAAFETEVSFILSDVQEFIRARSERAFSHLQRSIVVDASFREKWQEVFKNGEVACEKLGAVHLLLHGIWAFKVDAAGARTDLVFQEPAGDLTKAQRYADGFVLTEWKKANPKDDPGRRFDEARLQAGRYSQGALAGSELTSYRYAVVVSWQEVDVPDDLRENGVVYRHINIAVDPRTPSRA
jgi:hypothetical protein